MDPVQKLWLYHHWLGDQRDDAELAKNHAYLLASFSNPEAVKEMMNDSPNVYQSSDETFDETTKMVMDSISLPKETQTSKTKKRRKKAKLKDNQGING